MAKKTLDTPLKSAIQNYRDSLLAKAGEDAGFILTEDRVVPCAVIPSGLYPLDQALGVGGIPRGKLIEIYGPEGAGKTSLAMQFAAECQKADGFVHYIDAEHALDPNNLKAFGVNPELTLLSQPNSGEEAFSLVEFAADNRVPLVIVDSVAAMVPDAEMEAEMDQQFMGIHARLVTRGVHKITGKANRGDTTVIFINQIRMKPTSYGNPETTTGGHALKHHCSVRIDVRKGELFPTRENPTGQECNFKIVKNKVAPPFRSASVPLIYGQGFDMLRCLIEAGIAKGKVEKAGAWLRVPGNPCTDPDAKWQGFDALRAFLRDTPDLEAYLRKEVYA